MAKSRSRLKRSAAVGRAGMSKANQPKPPRLPMAAATLKEKRQRARAARRTGRKPPFRVRATAMNFYAFRRFREGDVFDLRDEADFKSRTMEWVNPRTPVKATTGVEDLKREHERIRAEKAAMPRGGAVGPDNPPLDVLGDDD